MLFGFNILIPSKLDESSTTEITDNTNQTNEQTKEYRKKE